jgi:hypothetical protein
VKQYLWHILNVHLNIILPLVQYPRIVRQLCIVCKNVHACETWLLTDVVWCLYVPGPIVSSSRSHHLSDPDWLLLETLDTRCQRPLHTGRFLTMHKRRRKRLTTRSLTQEPALLDDIHHGQVQVNAMLTLSTLPSGKPRESLVEEPECSTQVITKPTTGRVPESNHESLWWKNQNVQHR